MSIREALQEEMKSALRVKDTFRLECLRMAKGAILMKDKETGTPAPEEVVAATMRAEIRKRQQSIEIFREHGREAEALESEREIGIFEEFLPKQLGAEELESRVRAYLAEHPELNHAGKLTGAMKKELGDLAEGKMLNDVCRKVLEP